MFINESTHFERSRKNISTTFKALRIFPMKRLTNNTIIQHLDNPHAILQAIDVKEVLTGRQPNFQTYFLCDIHVG